MASPVKDAKLKAQLRWPGATVVERGKGYIQHQHPTNPNKFMLNTQVGGRGWHFGDGPFTEANEVDTAWIDADPVLDAPWQKKMELADYNAFFGPGTQEFDAGQIIKYVHPASGEDITFQVQQLQWTNDLDQISAIADPQQINPSSILDDTIIWEDAFGTGLDFSWQAQTARLSKLLTIQNSGAIGTPPQFILDGGNPVLRLQFIFQKSSGVEVWVDGAEWDEAPNNPIETLGDVEFRLDGATLWYFSIPSASSSDLTEEEGPQVIQKFRRVGPNLLVEVRVPWSWLETTTYPVVIDPTVEEQVGASLDDCWRYTTQIYKTSKNHYLDRTYTDIGAGQRFTTVAIDNGATIDTAYLILTPQGTVASPNGDAVIRGEDADDASEYSTNADYAGRSLTDANVTWDPTSWDDGVPENSPEIKTIVKEIVDRPGWATGQAMAFQTAGNQTSDILNASSYNDSSADAPELYVEWSTGVGPQTISMGYATLASAAQGLNVVPGAKSVPMSEATLVSAPQGLTVDAPFPPVTVSMSAATLVGAPQALSVLPGGVTIPMSEATLVGAPQALTALVSGGPLTISMAVATLVAAAQALNVAPGAVTAPMSAATLVSAAQALDVIPGAASVPMSAATLASAAQALRLILGPITVPMSAVTLASAAQALNVDAITGIIISMSVATLVAAAQALSVVPGGVSIPLGDIELAGSAQALTVIVPIEGTIIPMSAITLASAPQGLMVIPPDTTIAMSPTTLVGSAQQLTIKPGAVTIPLSAVTLVAALLTLNKVGLPYAAFFRIYALLGEHTPETAYNLQGEHIVEGTLEGEHIPETEFDIDGEV